MTWRRYISFNERVLGGKPVIKGTRVPVQIIVGSLAGGMDIEEICREYRVTEKDVHAALSYAAEVLTEERVHALSHR